MTEAMNPIVYKEALKQIPMSALVDRKKSLLL